MDGGTADETVQFSLDGKHYEIDLSDKNAAALRSALTGYVDSARRSNGARQNRSSSPSNRPSIDRDQNQAIRQWARGQGMKVSDRGRIPTEVTDAFNKAH